MLIGLIGRDASKNGAKKKEATIKNMFSDNFRLADPEYLDFVPRTVQEAILKFRRLQAKGLEAWMFPEALIKCGSQLPDEEAAKFEEWMINPAGEPPSNAMDVRDFLKAQAALDKEHGRPAPPTPALLPAVQEQAQEHTQDDEKKENDDEKKENEEEEKKIVEDLE